MGDNIKKFFKKLSIEEVVQARGYIVDIIAREYKFYNISKLAGKKHRYRFKKGRLRIIFYDNGIDDVEIIKITFRDENTYKNL